METGMRRYMKRAVGMLMLMLPLVAGAQQWGEIVNVRGPVKEDLYLAGGQVEVAGGVDGDVSAAGGHVTINDQVSGDVAAFGGTINLRASVQDDARLTGAEITVSDRVGDDLLAAGGSVSLAPTAQVGGRAWLAGGRIDVAGRVGKGLKAAGGQIVISGEVLGDVELFGETIEIRPDAVIHGKLNYRSPNAAIIDPGARIVGEVVASPIEAPPRRAGRTGGRVFMTISLIVTAGLVYLLFPAFSLSTARSTRESPWTVLGLGLAVVAAGPLVVALLLVSVVGLWLALIVLAVYLILLLLGYLNGVLFLADQGLRRLRKQEQHGYWWVVGGTAVVLIVLMLLRLVPVLGGLLSFTLMLFGLGALSRALWRQYSAPTAKPRARSTVRRRRQV